MDSPLNKVMLIKVVQHKSWWFLSKIFMESQIFKVGSSAATSKNHTESRFIQQPCLKLLEDKKYWEGRICNVPNFALGHNGQITLSIFMKFFKLMLKVK